MGFLTEFSTTTTFVMSAISGFMTGVALFYLVMRRTQKHIAKTAS
jgi:hypothetical protein